jgi:hypothetical protein
VTGDAVGVRVLTDAGEAVMPLSALGCCDGLAVVFALALRSGAVREQLMAHSNIATPATTFREALLYGMLNLSEYKFNCKVIPDF